MSISVRTSANFIGGPIHARALCSMQNLTFPAYLSEALIGLQARTWTGETLLGDISIDWCFKVLRGGIWRYRVDASSSAYYERDKLRVEFLLDEETGIGIVLTETFFPGARKTMEDTGQDDRLREIWANLLTKGIKVRCTEDPDEAHWVGIVILAIATFGTNLLEPSRGHHDVGPNRYRYLIANCEDRGSAVDIRIEKE
jgi:hypothetical protein